MMSKDITESKEYKKVYKKYYWTEKVHGYEVAVDHNNTLDKVFSEGAKAGRKIGIRTAKLVINSIEE